MGDNTEVVGFTGTAVETVLAVSQGNEVLQIVQIVLSIVTFVVTIAYTLWKWYKRATDDDSDGGKKITKKEVEELVDDLKDKKE